MSNSSRPQSLATERETSWVEMKSTREGEGAVLVRYGPADSSRLLRRLRKIQMQESAAWHGGNLDAAIVDQLSSASSLVATGLQSGQLFQVIGTPGLIAGLKSGAYTLMQAAGGTLGTVVSSTTGTITGQLRFAQLSIAPVLAPVLAWQALHAIAGTVQLAKINQRLDVMQRALENMLARQEAQVIGEVRWAVKALDDILAERTRTGTFTQEMMGRLSHVEKTVGSVLERNMVLVDRFRGKASAAHRLKGKSGATVTATLLREEGSQAVYDMELLVGLFAADLRVQQARLFVAMEHNPADVERRMERVSATVGDCRKTLEDLPSVEGLELHARECVDEMGWWQRNVFARGVTSKVSELNGLALRDVQAPDVPSLPGATCGYVFWRDDRGTQVRIVTADDALPPANDEAEGDAQEISPSAPPDAYAEHVDTTGTGSTTRDAAANPIDVLDAVAKDVPRLRGDVARALRLEVGLGQDVTKSDDRTVSLVRCLEELGDKLASSTPGHAQAVYERAMSVVPALNDPFTMALWRERLRKKLRVK